MKKLILIGIVALVVFMILKALLVIVSKITEKAFKVSDKKRDRFEFPLSVAIQLLFILIWLMSSEGVANKFGLNNLEFYISFCMIGIFGYSGVISLGTWNIFLLNHVYPRNGIE